MKDPLTIYGHPASQPSRTVFWACLIHDLPFALGDIGGNDPKRQLANPRGQIPWIVDDGFVLAEMAAIVGYLADKNDWDELYPKELKVRSRIHEFLHMHHGLVRLATLKLMAPHVMKPLGSSTRDENPLSAHQREALASAFASDDPLKDGGAIVRSIVEFLERTYLGRGSSFLCDTNTASIADLACYAELGQLQFANLFDFEMYPETRKWLDAMSRIPHHDTIHAFNMQLGDLATIANTPERFAAASQAGIAALRETGIVN